jgi:hypothetical protein
VKLRELLKKIDLKLRPSQVEERMRSADDDVDDALATAAWNAEAPTNWVPSQQDERPH